MYKICVWSLPITVFVDYIHREIYDLLKCVFQVQHQRPGLCIHTNHSANVRPSFTASRQAPCPQAHPPVYKITMFKGTPLCLQRRCWKSWFSGPLCFWHPVLCLGTEFWYLFVKLVVLHWLAAIWPHSGARQYCGLPWGSLRVKFGNLLVSVLWVGRGLSEWEGWERDMTGFRAVHYFQVAPHLPMLLCSLPLSYRAHNYVVVLTEVCIFLLSLVSLLRENH